jgi:hypothetical protein
MSYTYSDRKRTDRTAPQQERAPAQPSLESLRAGTAQPTQEQMGRRVDLPDAMRAKMENAFGADLSAVKLYESEAVAEAGANAVTRGSDIAFAPGMLDFSSYGGQALLGHELSHVVSQARGEVTGGGFLNDRALEARADREGAMAAAGQTVAMPAAAMSAVTAAPAAGPMQAKKRKTDVSAVKAANAGIGRYNTHSYLQDDVMRAAAGRQIGGATEQARRYNDSSYNQDTARAAYLGMAQADAADATPEQIDAFNAYTDDQTDINNYLRRGKGSVDASQRNAVAGQIKQMDSLFAQRSGLSEEMNVYRGVNDGFLEFLLQQGGFDAARYGKDGGGIDHDKLRSSGILDEINQRGIEYTDKAYVSTSTSRGFAGYFPVGEQIDDMRNMMKRQLYGYNRAHGKTGRDAQITQEENQAIFDAAMHNMQYESGIHMMNMHLSDDVKGLAIDQMASSEGGRKEQNEFLLNRGQGYKVYGIREVSPGRYEMDVEVMTAKGKKRVKQQMKKPK